MAAPPHRGLGVRGVVWFVGLVALLAGWLTLGRRQAEPGQAAAAEPPSQVLGAVPRDAMLVVRIDVSALRRTAVGQRLLGHGRSIAGLGEIGVLCGADPMDAVSELGVAIPTSGVDAGFGIFATGKLDAVALLDCAARIVNKRGGRPVRQRRGKVMVLSDAGARLSTAALAVAPGGPLVLAEPDYLGRSLAVLAGHAPSVLAEPEHSSLRRLLPAGVLVATAVFTPEQRRTLASELRAQGMVDSPFAAVSSAALSLQLGATLALDAVMRCSDAAACAAIAKQLERARVDQAGRAINRAFGLGGVLAELHIAPEGDIVRAKLSLPIDRALALANRLATLARADRHLPPSPPPPPDVDLPLAPPSASAALALPTVSPRPRPPATSTAPPHRTPPIGSATKH